MKLSEAVPELIRLGKVSRRYWDRELPKRHPHYPVIGAGETPVPPPPEDAQIQHLLERLTKNQIYALILLNYLGRGDFSVDELDSAYDKMKEAFPDKDVAIAQMTQNNTLAEYLEDATRQVQKRHIELDQLKFPSKVAAS